MSATELEEVQALLERVLPDPRGFAGRLLQQAITQYGLLAEPAATAFYGCRRRMSRAGEDVIVADQWAAEQPPIDTNILLAAALGACECWGLRADCDLCQGRARPAGPSRILSCSKSLSGPPSKGCPPAAPGSQAARPARTGDDHDSHQTVQGENA